MGLFSFLRKNTQESASRDRDGEFYTRAEQETGGRGKRKRGGQDSEAVDPVLPEKKRARRRLVGAIALVLAAIIGLPMILDSEPKPLADDIAIQIPSRDKPAAAGSILPAPPASASTAASKSAAVAGLDKNEEVIDPAAAAKKPPAQVAAVVPVKPEPKAGPKAAVAPQPVEKPNDPARAIAILDGKADVKPEKAKVSVDKKPAKYVLQVAALGSQDKVNELQNKLKGAGIKSYTQKVPTESGQRIRVRVGPFGSKEEAEKTRARLVKLGLNGTLVSA
jgi:DedD protein